MYRLFRARDFRALETTLHKILLYAALILAISWLVIRVLRGTRSSEETTAKQITDESSAYHAVSLRYSGNACNAAKSMTGRRFLASAAPRLPLPECNSLECRCRFVHHADRRTGKDRRSPFSPASMSGGTGTFKAERREKKDRRKNADPGDH